MKESTEFVTLPLEIEIPDNIRDFNLGLMFRESLDFNKGMLFVFDEVGQKSFHMSETKIPLDIAFITEDGIVDSIKELEPYDENPVSSDGKVLTALEVNRGWFAENNVEVGDEIEVELDEAKDKKGKGSGTKDACYHKVKSRYSVGPSAYASGVLVKCRKVGAANCGNSTKKEEYEVSNWKDDFKPTEIESTDIITPEPLQPTKGIGSDMLDEKCKQITQKRRDTLNKTEVAEAKIIRQQHGNIYRVSFIFRGKYMMMKIFFPEFSRPSKEQVQGAIDKVYPGAKVQRFDMTPYQPGEPLVMSGIKEDWQKENRKDKTEDANRRKSFCSRMKGMKKRLTSAKTARDPDSRINKDLRRWNC
jgi:uncharacterized membrane protein (UPF0127 family)